MKCSILGREDMKRINRFSIILCTIIFILFIPSLKADAAQINLNRIKVGFYEVDGFQYSDEYGYKAGYNFDYLNYISFMTGWEYEFVDVEDFAKGRKMLSERKIDLLAPCLKMEATTNNYMLSEVPFGIEYVVLITNKDNREFFYDDYENFNGMKVAAVENHPLTTLFEKHIKEKGCELDCIYFQTYEECLEAMESGKVDATVSSLMKIGNKYKVIARFSPVPVYYATWNGNGAFIRKLDDAMRGLNNVFPGIQSELTDIHFPRYNEQYFTREDYEFIKNKESVRVGYVPGRVPVSYTGKDGSLAGVSRSIFDRVSEICGIDFEYVELPYGEITYAYLNEHEIDMITGIEDNNYNRNNSSMIMSSPYFTSSKVMVGRDSTGFSTNEYKKLGISSGSKMLKKKLERQYPNFDIIVYDTVKECFEAVRKGDIDFLIQNQYVVENWLSRPQYDDLNTVPMEGYDDSLCFAITASLNQGRWEKSDEHIQLIRIVDKALSQMTTEENNLLSVHATMENQYSYSLKDFIYQYRTTLLVLSIGFFVGIFVLIYINTLRENNRNLAERERTNLKLQQRRYKLVMESANEMLYEVSMSDNAGFSSEEIKKKFGWEIPKHVENLSHDAVCRILHIHPDDFNNFIFTDGDREEGIARLQMANGDYRWCKITKSSLLDDQGKLLSVVGKIEDVDLETREKVKLKNQARIDGLTGLLNKKTFMEELKKYIHSHDVKYCGFIFIDMDHFKEVNDTLGHDMGDIAIKDTAEKLQLIFSNIDFVSRFGGDEFCIFVKNIPFETLEDKLKFAVDKLSGEYSDEKNTIVITASIGVAYSVTDKMDFDSFFKFADNALYKAKDMGRNCYLINTLKE